MSESELGATPVPALRIVPERKQSDRNRWHLKETQRENFKLYKRFLFFYFLFFKKKKKVLGGEVGNRPDRVVGSHPNPVGDRPVLTHLLRQLFLYYKCLVGRLRINIYTYSSKPISRTHSVFNKIH